MTDSAIIFQQVSFAYSPRRFVLERVSTAFSSGKITVILGPSGSGKSTILRLAAGLLLPAEGKVVVNVGQAEGSGIPRFSMVFQDGILYPHLSLRNNALLPFQVKEKDLERRQSLLMELAPEMGLEEILSRKPQQVSVGQRQRAALLKTVISGAPIWLLDEPLTAIDTHRRLRLRSLVARLQRRLSSTILYVTHDINDALALADFLVVIDDGKIVQAGPVREVLDHPSSVQVPRFLTSPPMNELSVVITQADGKAPQLTFSDGTVRSYHGIEIDLKNRTHAIAMLSPDDVFAGEPDAKRLDLQDPQYLVVPGRVEIVEHGKRRVCVECETPIGTIRYIATENSSKVIRGDSVSLHVNVYSLSLFDLTTGQALCATA